MVDTCQAADRRPSYRGRLSQVRSLLAERRQLVPRPPSTATATATATATPSGSTPAGTPPAAGTPHGGAAGPLAFVAEGEEGAGESGQLPPAAQHVLVGLAPPRPMGSALMMRRPWALLLRLVLQLGLSQVHAADGWGCAAACNTLIGCSAHVVQKAFPAADLKNARTTLGSATVLYPVPEQRLGRGGRRRGARAGRHTAKVSWQAWCSAVMSKCCALTTQTAITNRAKRSIAL
jgi:hypothetical protein